MSEVKEVVKVFRITVHGFRYDGLEDKNVSTYLVSGENAYTARQHLMDRYTGPEAWLRRQITDVKYIGDLVNLHGEQLWEKD